MSWRTRGRKFLCRHCGRKIGEHGYSNSAGLAIHKCPHGQRCEFDIHAPRYTKCWECGKAMDGKPGKNILVEDPENCTQTGILGERSNRHFIDGRKGRRT